MKNDEIEKELARRFGQSAVDKLRETADMGVESLCDLQVRTFSDWWNDAQNVPEGTLISYNVMYLVEQLARAALNPPKTEAAVMISEAQVKAALQGIFAFCEAMKHPGAIDVQKLSAGVIREYAEITYGMAGRTN